jgi:dolichol-phosphate mannosyltransferase
VLVERLAQVIDEQGWAVEIIFVTDLNTDRTVEVLREQNARDPRVKMLKFTNSFGQHVAVMAGLRASRGDAVVLMDGDLQDYPEDIPKLYECYSTGKDVVYATKERKNDSLVRNFFSASFVWLINKLSDRPVLHNTSMFRIMSRRVVDVLSQFHEHDPVVTGLVSLIGFPTGTVQVTSGTRQAGETKYGFMRQLNLAIGFLLAFSTKPLRIISMMGLLVSALSLMYLVIVIVQTLLGLTSVLGWPTLVCLITFLGGVQLIALGVIGENVGRIFLETKRRPLYIVEEKIGDLSQTESDPAFR